MSKLATGTLVKAGFQIGLKASDWEFPTTEAEADADAELIRTGHQLPVLSENLQEFRKLDPDNTLTGTAVQKPLILREIGAGGSIQLEGSYLGIGRLIACALGLEEEGSPTCVDSLLSSFSDTVGAGSDADTIYSNGGIFTTDITGEYLTYYGANSDQYYTRRITSTNTAAAPNNYVELASALPVSPTVGHLFRVGRAWKHLYEPTPRMEAEAKTWGAAFTHTKTGTLCIDKQIGGSHGIWEYRTVAVESMRMTLNSNGCFFEFELVPFDLDRGNSAVNTASTGWNYGHASAAIILQEKLLLGDTNFYMHDYSTSSVAGDQSKRITDFELTVKNNLSNSRSTQSGYHKDESHRNGFRTVDGSISFARYDSDVDAIIEEFHTNSVQSAWLEITGGDLGGDNGVNNLLELFLRALQITKVEAITAGAGTIIPRIDFTAIEPTGNPYAGTNLMPTPDSEGEDQPEIMIRLANSDPYNAFYDTAGE